MIGRLRFEWVAERWNQFWFTPARATDLGTARVLFFGITLVAALRLHLADWGAVPHLFWMPTPLFQALRLQPESTTVLGAVDLVWKGSLLLSAIGLFSRWSMPLAAISGFYALGLPQNFGKVHHSDTLLVLMLFVFACSRAGDAVSIDRLRRLARATGPRPIPEPLIGAEYRWPVRFALALFVAAFAGAGLSKLRVSGLSWAWSDNMRNTLLAHHYDHRPPTDIGLWLASHESLTRLLAAGSLALELGSISALFSRWTRAIVVASIALMQVGIWLLMGVLFLGYASVYPVLIPWSALGQWLRHRTAPRSRTVMIFDGSCGICTRTRRVVGALDILGRIEMLDAVREWDVIARRFPALSQIECLTDMHVVSPEGQVQTGFGAYRLLAWQIPLAWILLPVLYLPPVPQLGARVYRAVADNRLSHGCELAWRDHE